MSSDLSPSLPDDAERTPSERPLIGVTGRRFPAETLYPNDTLALGGIVLDAFFQPYAERIAAVGGATVFLPRESDPSSLVAALDGVLLAGGQDIEPARYGGEASHQTTPLDPGQDAFDLAIALAALERGIPILGTCRGHEVLNVALGGTLCDHGHAHHDARSRPAAERAHRVSFAEGSRLRELYGAETRVNSLHHQAVERVADGARVTARSDDGLVEAIELDEHAAIGVQWHPELHDGVDPVLGWLVETARERSRALRVAVAG